MKKTVTLGDIVLCCEKTKWSWTIGDKTSQEYDHGIEALMALHQHLAEAKLPARASVGELITSYRLASIDMIKAFDLISKDIYKHMGGGAAVALKAPSVPVLPIEPSAVIPERKGFFKVGNKPQSSDPVGS